MIKKIKFYQRIVFVSVCVAVLGLVLSLFSLGMHYFYLDSTYHSIINEEQEKILQEIEGLTIKEAIDKGYGPQISLLLKPREEVRESVSKVKQIENIALYAWISGCLALFVICVLVFLYYYVRQVVIKTIRNDMNSVLLQVKQVVSGVDLKEQKVILDVLPLVLEVMGYRSMANWLRSALSSEASADTSS